MPFLGTSGAPVFHGREATKFPKVMNTLFRMDCIEDDETNYNPEETNTSIPGMIRMWKCPMSLSSLYSKTVISIRNSYPMVYYCSFWKAFMRVPI